MMVVCNNLHRVRSNSEIRKPKNHKQLFGNQLAKGHKQYIPFDSEVSKLYLFYILIFCLFEL